MNKENISYVCIIICALVALAIVSIYALEYSQEKTNLKIISDSNLHNGDSFNLRLSDAYNRPIDNKSVEITVICDFSIFFCKSCFMILPIIISASN